MIYLLHYPSHPLNQFIYNFYYLDGVMPFPREKILPVPYLDLKINLGDPHHVIQAGQAEGPKTLRDGWLTAMFDCYHMVEWPVGTRLYGVRFKPGGAFPLMGLPLSEVHNQVVPLDLLWGNFIDGLKERLCYVTNIREGFTLLERQLIGRLEEYPRIQTTVDHAISIIGRNRGALSIKDLSEVVGVSPNHLRRQFKLVVGTSVKELARLYRFANVLRYVNPSNSANWAKIAQRFGFYDQSHLNKEFYQFAGLSPTAYQLARSQVYTTDAAVDQEAIRNLPVV